MKFTLEHPRRRPRADAGFFEAPLARIGHVKQEFGLKHCAPDHPAPSAKWFEAGGHDSFERAVASAYAAAATMSLALLTKL